MRRILTTTAVVLVALCIAGLVAVGINAHVAGSGSQQKAAQASNAAQAKTQQALSVDPSKVPANFCAQLMAKYGYKNIVTVKGVKTPFFDLGAAQPVGTGSDKRLWSDGTNTPQKPMTLAAIEADVCHDPGEAGMIMNGLGGNSVGDKTIAQLNSWIGAQGSPTTAIHNWVASCIDTTNVTRHLICARQMSFTAYLLSMFHDDGVIKTTTAWNVHLAGPTVGGVPYYELNPKQYTGYFVKFSYTTKASNVCLVYGINVGKQSLNGGDRRLAGLSCATPGKPPVKGHAPPAPIPPHKVPPPTKSTPTPKPSTTHPTPHPTPTTSSPTPTSPPTTAPPTSPPTSPPTTKPPTSPPTTPPPSTQPPKTCKSVYGPGYSGTYPNCTKDGTTAPNPPTGAPGTNPAPGSGGGSTPNPTSSDPGSSTCWTTDTVEPVPANPDGSCPSGSTSGF